MKKRSFFINSASLCLAFVIAFSTAAIAADRNDLRGDMNGDGMVNSDDAIYLLRHTLDPDKYPLNGEGSLPDIDESLAELARLGALYRENSNNYSIEEYERIVAAIEAAEIGVRAAETEAQVEALMSMLKLQLESYGYPQAGDTNAREYAIVDLDFETELPLADYVSSNGGVSVDEVYGGGEIVDGKWVYSGRALALKDESGIFSLDYYSIEFDFCFDSFVNKDNFSVFTLVTDDDGVLNGSSSFYSPFKMDISGLAYHNSAKSVTVQIEQGKKHHYKLEVDNVRRTVTVYIDGELMIFASYKQELRDHRYFRLMDTNGGAEMWIDNFVITDTLAVKNASTERVAKAVDGAYTRGGIYADEPQGIADELYIDIKHSQNDKSYDRHGFLKFDISKFERDDVRYAAFYGCFAQVNAASLFDIYLISSDWDSKTLTYNSMPSGERIFSNVSFSNTSTVLDFTDYVKNALDKGEEYLSVKIVPVNQPSNGQTRLYYTNDVKPTITLYKSKPVNGYFTELTGNTAKDKEIWDYAQRIYDEWYERYRNLPAVNENAVLLGKDESQYTKTNYMSGNSTNYATSKTAHKSRPLDALTDLDVYVSDEFKNATLDKYGGAMIESLKQEATGFFYAKKIEGRWWLVDPLGYPYIAIGLSDIHYSQLGSELQKENALRLYGSYDNWALATTRQVRDELYFNNTFRPVSNIIELENGLPFGAPGNLMSSYGNIKNVKGDGNGSTVFTENNTMPVFDPDFASYAKSWAKQNIKYVGNDRLIGYMSDNELPMNVDMLDRALSVNHTREANWYTYACTWTWFCNITGKKAPSAADITDELRDLYRGFVWDKYFNIASAEIKKCDPDHMYLGARFLTVSNKSQWVYRFAAQYLDCMTINWYGDWEPDATALYGIARNGDLPFIITEFYTKAGDSGLGNTSGAGRFVATQTDRADFYETFTIRLLETANCVGWQWFQYMDNDPNSGTGDKSSIDSNKGIYRSDFTLYTELTDRMTVLNKNVYNIIDYFANKK